MATPFDRTSTYSASGNAEYDALPDSVKQAFSLKEWLWMSDADKAGLVGSMCQPEWEEPL